MQHCITSRPGHRRRLGRYKTVSENYGRVSHFETDLYETETLLPAKKSLPIRNSFRAQILIVSYVSKNFQRHSGVCLKGHVGNQSKG